MSAKNKYRIERPEDDEEDAAPVAKVNEQPESTWEKRYGDLRRHADKKEKEAAGRIKELEERLTELEKNRPASALPSSEEELKAWMQQFPAAANHVISLARREAERAVESVRPVLSEVREIRTHIETADERAAIQDAMNRLLKLHPDFGEIQKSEEFRTWLAAQHYTVRDGIEKNATDVEWASSTIQLYKNSRKAKNVDGEAARTVPSRRSGDPATSDSAVWSESKVAKLTSRQYDEYEEEIDKAKRSGKFVYDLSGAHR